MERIVALGILIVHIYTISVSHAYPETVGTVIVDDGQVGIGVITGGKFGPGSFSIGQPGSPKPRPEYYDQNDSDEDEDDRYDVLQNPANNDAQRKNNLPPQHGSTSEPNKSGGNRGNTQVNPVKPQRAQSNHAKPQRAQIEPEQGGIGGQEGSGGQIVIGTVVFANKKKNKGNQWRNNKQPASNNALEVIAASNIGNNGYPSSGNDFGSNGNIHIGLITGGNFEQGTMFLNDEKLVGANGSHKGSGVGNGIDTLYAIGHGANSNGGWHAGDGYVNGQQNSEYDYNTGRHENDEYANGQMNSGYDYDSGSNAEEKAWIWSS